MLVSAELRWFWKDAPPRGLEAWYRSGPFPPGGGSLRRDEYLLEPLQTELGLKKRGGDHGVDVKGLVSIGTALPKPFAGRIELWTKWVSTALSIDHLPRVVVAKTRWLRKFDTAGPDVRELALGPDEQLLDRSKSPPDRGCLVELVSIQLGDSAAPWSALAFESFGPLDSVQESLRRTALHVAQRTPPPLEEGLQLSYAEWLSRCSRQP
jgi:hypothetical protein